MSPYLWTDGNLFNLARLRAKSRCREICVQELLCADDTALVVQSLEYLQIMLDRFLTTSEAFEVTINIGKTEVLLIIPTSSGRIT